MAGSYVSLCLIGMVCFEVCFASEHECSTQPMEASLTADSFDAASMLMTAAAVPKLVGEQTAAGPKYVRIEGESCAEYENGFVPVNTAGVSPATCKSQCDADSGCVSYHTVELAPSNYPPHCIINKAKCTKNNKHAWFVYYVKEVERYVFSIVFPPGLGAVPIGGVERDFKEYVKTCILPLAAKNSKTLYACEKGNQIAMYTDFADDQQSAYYQTWQWKPAAYWAAVAQTGCTFPGVSKDLKLVDKLSEHAFNAGIGCCQKIAAGDGNC